MTDHDRNAEAPRSNGKRTALIVVLVAFVASATTAILAISESHRVQTSDAAALAGDVGDLHALASDWADQVDAVRRAPVDEQSRRLDDLRSRIGRLDAWKARTPCGHDAQQALRASADTRVAYMQRVVAKETVPEAHIDERQTLDQSLQRCSDAHGRDVTI